MKKILILFATLLLVGCGKTVTWQEEVQFSDGRIIVVERETVRVMGGPELAHGGSGTTPKERRIRFKFPIGSESQVEWRSTKMSPSLVPEKPLVLDIQQGIPLLLTSVSVSEGCSQYMRYLYENGQWREATLTDEFEATPTNLLLMSGPNMPSFVDLATKTKDIADIRYPRSLKRVGPRRTFCHG